MEKIVINKTVIKSLDDDSVTFEVPKNIVRYLDDKKETEVTLKIEPYVKGRTLNQNAKLWALIGDIDKEMNGRRSADGETAIYMNLIQMANVKTVIQAMSFEALEEVARRKIYKHIEVLSQTDYMVTCRCYYGSSDFTTKEMADFIEATLDYASELGMDLTEYKELRK